MLGSSSGWGVRIARRAALSPQRASIPDFLLPSFSQAVTVREFSSTRPQASRIGAAVLALPDDVTLTIINPPPQKSGIVKRVAPVRKIHIEGPLGKLSVDLPHYMTLTQDSATRKASLSIEDKAVRKQREMWGTTRATLNNHILGVSEGHSTILRLNGVGYRALIEKQASTKTSEYPGQEFVNLKVGYSHPIEMPVPEGVKATAPQPTRILLEGRNKEVVNQFAAELRAWRRPEPYKGKGIFVNGETIRLKAKKIK